MSIIGTQLHAQFQKKIMKRLREKLRTDGLTDGAEFIGSSHTSVGNQLIEVLLIMKAVMKTNPPDDHEDTKADLATASKQTELHTEAKKKDDDDETPSFTRKLSSLEEKINSLKLKEEKVSLSPWKKDFVISGRVGEPSHEKDIGYLGTVRQMKEGLEKGYKETEVVGAVLKAIAPRSLKTYLGMIEKLGCDNLCKYLRIHYQEKSATELYQELINMKQLPKETPIAFAVRAFETREKILIASREGGREAYDEKQVRQLCKSTIETGIDENISFIIRPMLSQPISDVDLMTEISKAEALIQLRQQKSGEKRTSVRLNMIAEKSEDSEVLKAIKGIEAKLSSVDDLKREVRELKAQVGEMKKKRHSSEENNYRQEFDTARFTERKPESMEEKEALSYSYSERKCLSCHNEQKETCHHCYRCGSSEHYANFPGCRGMGNYRGLSRGGRR